MKLSWTLMSEIIKIWLMPKLREANPNHSWAHISLNHPYCISQFVILGLKKNFHARKFRTELKASPAQNRLFGKKIHFSCLNFPQGEFYWPVFLTNHIRIVSQMFGFRAESHKPKKPGPLPISDLDSRYDTSKNSQ